MTQDWNIAGMNESLLFDSSKNLFDPTKATPNSAVNTSNGSLDAHTYYVTDFIPVIQGLKYVANGGQTKNYAWYDANKTFISGGTNLATLIAPTNAAFIRVTITPSEFGAYQFEQGNTQTPYTPYRSKESALFTLSKNLFDPYKATFNKTVNASNGTLDVNNGYYATDFIPVTVGLKYVANGGQTKNYAWYDANKTFISGGLDISNLIAPTNAAFIRVTINPTDYQTYQFEQGNTQTTYIPYGSRTLKNTQNSGNRFYNKKANFLGDSITWGYSPIDGSQLLNPYPKLVGNALGLNTVRNYGVSGTTIAGAFTNRFIDRYSSMDNDADLIFVLGGTNDWAQSVPIGTINDAAGDTFYGGLNMLVTGLLNKYLTQTIVLATPMHRQTDTTSLVLVNYRNAILDIGAKYGVAVLDLYATSGFYPDNTANYNAICPDGRHPNDAGHIKLANRVSGFLTTV